MEGVPRGRHKRPITAPVVLVFVVFLILMVVSLGCQQHRKPSNLQDETIDVAMHACVEPEWIGWTRFFSPATFNLVNILLVVYLFTPSPSRPGDHACACDC